MKIIITMMMLTCTIGAAAQDELRHIKPEAIHQMPKISVEEYKKSIEVLENEEDNLSFEEMKRVGDLTVYTDLYSGFCSWYCGGEILKVSAAVRMILLNLLYHLVLLLRICENPVVVEACTECINDQERTQKFEPSSRGNRFDKT